MTMALEDLAKHVEALLGGEDRPPPVGVRRADRASWRRDRIVHTC